jgi:hypothetical protein
VVTAELCWSRVIAGSLVFSKEAPDILWELGRCLGRIGVLPEKLVWDREGAIHAFTRREVSWPRSASTRVSPIARILSPWRGPAQYESDRGERCRHPGAERLRRRYSTRPGVAELAIPFVT